MRLFMSNVNTLVVNANHERVMAVVDKFLVERYRNVCTCPRCMCDIVAMALNYLPPHYVVERDKGKEFGSPWVMVETAVAEAIDRVMENPNHPRTKSNSGQATITAQEL
jgi:competence protein ComFB